MQIYSFSISEIEVIKNLAWIKQSNLKSTLNWDLSYIFTKKEQNNWIKVDMSGNEILQCYRRKVYLKRFLTKLRGLFCSKSKLFCFYFFILKQWYGYRVYCMNISGACGTWKSAK